MDLNDLYSEPDEVELAELGASVSGRVRISPSSLVRSAQLAQWGKPTTRRTRSIPRIRTRGGVFGRISSQLRQMGSVQVLVKALAKAKAAGATPAQLAKLRKSSPANIARVANASPAQVRALLRIVRRPKRRIRVSSRTRKSLARKLRAVKAKRRKKRKPKRRKSKKLLRLKHMPIRGAAYRQLACTSGVGGASGLAMLRHIKSVVDLMNTRQVATSEHNVLNNTQAFRRAVLAGLRRASSRHM